MKSEAEIRKQVQVLIKNEHFHGKTQNSTVAIRVLQWVLDDPEKKEVKVEA